MRCLAASAPFLGACRKQPQSNVEALSLMPCWAKRISASQLVPVRSFFEEEVAGLIVCFVAGSVLLCGLVRRVTREFSYAMEWIFYDPGRTGRCWPPFFIIKSFSTALLKSVKYQCNSSRWKATMYYQIKQLFKHRNSRLVDFVYRFCSTFFIELSSYSKSRLTDDTYLRKTKSLLDHFKPSLARDRLFVIVIFVHSLQR